MLPTTVIARRLRAQLLSGPAARDAAGVAERLLAIQGQDPKGVRLAIRSRSRGLTVADVDRALTDERTLTISWLNRGTLHLVRTEDWRWLHALTTPQLAASSRRRLAQEGVAPEQAGRGVRTIERALTRNGPMTRAELRDALDAASIPTAGQALVHLIFRAALEGVLVRGPVSGREQAFVLVEDWIPRTKLPPRDQSLAELARRFLAGHAPASDRDLAQWAGVTLGDARRGLSSISSHLDELEGGLVALRGQSAARALPPPRLLGAFDPVLLGWASRAPIVGDATRIITNNGVFHPFAMVDGRAVARWKTVPGGVELTPFVPIGPLVRERLNEDGRDVVRFLGGPVRSPR